jgi:hypothetical protein
VVLEMLPQTLADSPYAAKDGFAAVKAAAPCVRKRGFRINFESDFSSRLKKVGYDISSLLSCPIDKKNEKKKRKRESRSRAKRATETEKKSDETIDSREEQPNPLEYRKT